MRNAMHVLLVAAGIAVGGLGSSLLRSTASDDVVMTREVATSAAEPSTAERAPLVIAPGATLDPEALRAVVRDELARSRAEDQAREAERTEREVVELDAAQLRAAREARDVLEEHLEGALAEGVWDDEDRAAAIASLAEMTIEDREALILSLARAINEGRIAVTSSGPPWG